MKELVFPETFELCSPKESCMTELVFLGIFNVYSKRAAHGIACIE